MPARLANGAPSVRGEPWPLSRGDATPAGDLVAHKWPFLIPFVCSLPLLDSASGTVFAGISPHSSFRLELFAPTLLAAEARAGARGLRERSRPLQTSETWRCGGQPALEPLPRRAILEPAMAGVDWQYERRVLRPKGRPTLPEPPEPEPWEERDSFD